MPNKFSRWFFALFFAVFLLFSCNNEGEKSKPAVLNDEFIKEPQDSLVTKEKEVVKEQVKDTTVSSPDSVVQPLSHEDVKGVISGSGSIYYGFAKDSIYLHPINIERIDWFNYKKGNAVLYTDLPYGENMNTRIWLTQFFNDFSENDYLTGEELALFYKNNKEMNVVIRTAMASFFKNNIKRVVRQDNRFIIRTIDVVKAVTTFKIPLLVSFSLTIYNGSSIRIGNTLVSNKELFDGWSLLPITLDGIEIIQNKDTIPREGYIYNNAYFVDYPKSHLNYRFKK